MVRPEPASRPVSAIEKEDSTTVNESESIANEFSELFSYPEDTPPEGDVSASPNDPTFNLEPQCLSGLESTVDVMIPDR
jgi:hypothetical protein